MNRHWRFFSKAAIDPVHSQRNGHCQGNAGTIGLEVGDAAIAAFRVECHRRRVAALGLFGIYVLDMALGDPAWIRADSKRSQMA
jgi:hypothetical protein